MNEGSRPAVDQDPHDVWDVLTPREQDAARSLKSAVIGIFFCPLQIYTVWLLFLVAGDSEPLRAKYFWYAALASVVCLSHLAIVSLLVIIQRLY